MDKYNQFSELNEFNKGKFASLNHNLMKCIIDYLNVRDLIKITKVSKKVAKASLSQYIVQKFVKVYISLNVVD